MQAHTDVVVVGGGATGCGVARDLATRGLDVTLLERDRLNGGTTGRSHGLLHSGARYADVDPDSARACREEGRVLRRIAGACIEDTGGYVLQLEADDDAYFERKLRACRDAGIEAAVVEADDLHDRVPGLSPAVVRAIAVPDAVVYPSRLVAATAAAAREHGATIRSGVAAASLEPTPDGPVEVGLDRRVGSADGPRRLTAAHVVNAAGAWAGAVAAIAGVEVTMAPTRGLLVAVAHDGLGVVLNRCRQPGDGDILVPHPGSVVCGTTSVPVEAPDDPGGSEAEVLTVRREAAAMVPALADAPTLEQFWGVRPLHDPGGRGATRGFAVLDHADRDDVPWLTTVVGGKLTTHRRMAEATADHVAGRLGVDAPSRTAEDPLPGHDDPDRLDDLVAAFDAAGPTDGDVVDGSS